MNASHPFARFAQFRLMCIEYPLVVTHRETSTYIKVPLKSWSDVRQALHAVTDPRAAFLSTEDVQASTWFQRMDRGHGDTELSGKIWGKMLTYDREEIEKLAVNGLCTVEDIRTQAMIGSALSRAKALTDEDRAIAMRFHLFMDADALDYRIIHENVENPFTPFHRATYGLNSPEHLPIMRSVPDSMLVAKKLVATHESRIETRPYPTLRA